MGGQARKLRREQAREAARAATRKGLCARCQRPSTEHPRGDCPDGAGTFQWAMDEAALTSVIEKLEAAGEEPRLELTKDEQRVLDFIVDRSLGSPSSPEDIEFRLLGQVLAPGAAERVPFGPHEIAKALGMPLHHVRTLMNSLTDKRCLERRPGGLS